MSVTVTNKINSIVPIHDYDDWDYGLFTSDENQNRDLLFEKELEDFQKETEGKACCCDEGRIFIVICCCIFGFIIFWLIYAIYLY